MGHYLWMAVIGLVVGALAKLVVPGRDSGGIIMTMLLGIAGSFVAGYVGQILGWYQMGQTAGFVASLVGAIVLLLLYRMFVKKPPE